jgi:hypothetical protein
VSVWSNNRRQKTDFVGHVLMLASYNYIRIIIEGGGAKSSEAVKVLEVTAGRVGTVFILPLPAEQNSKEACRCRLG